MSRRVWCEGGDRLCKLREKPPERRSCQMSLCKVWETGEWNVVGHPKDYRPRQTRMKVEESCNSR